MTRRRFIQAGSMLGLTLGFAPLVRATTATNLEAYADATSVKQGGKLIFRARDPQGSLTADRTVSFGVGRIGLPDEVMLDTTTKVRNRVVPSNAYVAGCGWPATYTLSIPLSWPSGLYYAVFGSDAETCCVPFVVSPATKSAATKILIQVPVNTAQAYNNYGGKSLYGYNSTSGIAAAKVSFDRPYIDAGNYAFDGWQAQFAEWLDKNNITADFCTNVDLHQNSNLLNGYQLLVTVGHDEYWSREMRDRLDAFVAAGGNVAVLGGNTCWWQVRMEPNSAGTANRTLVCYKDTNTDPDSRAAYKTVNWVNLVPPYPENSSIGLGWLLGASWVNPTLRPDTPYVVQRGEHWVFAGTGLTSGAQFGGAYSGYEIDALAWRKGGDGWVYPSFTDGTPNTMTVLALADASKWDEEARARGQSGEKSGYGAIGIFSRGGKQGTVFNAGAIEWVYGLIPEINGDIPTPISQITLNVINMLSAAHTECVDVRRHSNVQQNGDGVRYFFTIAKSAPAGSSLDGKAFRAFAAATVNTSPVYRYKYPQSNGDDIRYYYSLNANIGNGWIADGVAFHAYAKQVDRSAPIYLHHIAQANGDGWRFMLSPLTKEAGGWILDGVAFFAPTA